MHVLHVMASAARGGGAEHLIGLLPELGRVGVTCSVVTGYDGPLAEQLRSEGIEVQQLDLMARRLDPIALYRLRGLVQEIAPDIIHYHGTRAAFSGALVRFLGRGGLAPSVYTAHGLAYRQNRGRWEELVFCAAEGIACRGAHEVLSVSREDLRDLQKRWLVPDGSGVHVPNAVDCARFESAPGRAEARRRLGLPDGTFVVGTVSRLVRQKGVDVLIDAVAQVPDARLVIVGDGELREVLEARAAPLMDRVVFLGARGDVPELLPAFDAFVLSSRWEGEPISLLEAMAVGLPCVATGTAGALEIIDSGVTGLVCDIDSVMGLATCLRELRADPKLRQRIGLAGQEAVSMRSYACSAQRIFEVYRGIAGSSGYRH